MNKMKQLDVPILFIIFRRKSAATKVVKAIAKVKPKKLYVSQDGPRNKEEKKLVSETREAVLDCIDWECELTTWFHSKNLGIKKHIPGALDKFFEKEEYGIYLEDDTLPTEHFFVFQKELLERYKDNEIVFGIKAVNLYPDLTKTRDSYFPSQIGGCWGLGLWRRSWDLYNSNPSDLDSFTYKKYEDYVFSKKFFERLKFFLSLVREGKLDTWDYQLTYAAMKNRQYFLTPSKNLVKNLGINKQGSNLFLSKYDFDFDKNIARKIIHPDQLRYTKKKDKDYYEEMYNFTYLRLILNKIFYLLPASLRSLIRNSVNRV